MFLKQKSIMIMTILNAKELMSINEDDYNLIIINDAFNSNYIECESKGHKDKHYELKNMLMSSGHI